MQGRFHLAYSSRVNRLILIAGILASLATGCPIHAQTAPAATVESPFVFAVSSDNALPLADIEANKLSAGILKDVGDAIAARLHRKASYVIVTRKRLDGVLTNGAADGVCYVRPEWMEARLNWGPAMIPNEIMLVASGRTAKPGSLNDVAGKTLGVVRGYKYPELDSLRQNYRREDAPSMASNINKFIAGRMDYAIVDRLSLDYQRKIHPEFTAFTALPITGINAACAFSVASKIPFAEIRLSINALINEGAVDRILAQYR